MSKVQLLIGLLTLLGVALFVWWDWNKRTSPGPLHPSHVLLAKLQGNAGCIACHGEKKTKMDAACESCHHEIADQRKLIVGLHGLLKRDKAENCASCHTDHTGGAVALITARSFESAGVAKMEAFDHSGVTRFTLIDRHTELKCEQCHHQAKAPALLEGQKRFLGLKQDCVACHKDAHQGTFGPDCQACHGQKKEFAKADGFVHTNEFPLVEVHAGKKCADCHQSDGPTSVKASFGTKMAVRTCVACHKDVHEGAYGNDCASCHGTSKPFKVVPLFTHTTDFPLTGGHADLACIKCHAKDGPNSVASLKVTNKSVRGCVECHASPHPEKLTLAIAKSPIAAKDVCATCHHADHKSFLFPAATMTSRQHEATGFSLAKPHDKTDCAGCHSEIGKRKKIDPGPDLATKFAVIYAGRAQEDCAKCHADVHKGQFAKTPSAGRCVVCHSMTTFKPNNFDAAMHKQTKFAIDGAHLAVSCAACHKKKDDVVQFVGVASSCTDCHADVHRGTFDVAGTPKTVDGKVGCARCHSTGGFGQITWTAKDHDLWTSYKLLGKHAEATCVACHKRVAPGKDVARTLGIAPKTCIACHADPHGGQFEKHGTTDCARCHSEAATFKDTTFNHQRDSVFKLDVQHIKLACATCHREVEVAPKVKIVRYLPLGSKCVDCHDPRPDAKKGVP